MLIIFLLLIFHSTIYAQEEYYEYYDESDSVTYENPESTISQGDPEQSVEAISPPTITITNFVTNNITNYLTNYITLPNTAPISINACTAILSQNFNELKTFVEKNPSIITKNRGDGNNLLHLAASVTNEEIISYLIEKGTDIKHTNISGQTPLHVAVLNNNFIGVNTLLKAEAPVFIQDIRGHTPIGIANLKNYSDILRLLLQYAPNSSNLVVTNLKKIFLPSPVPSNFDLYSEFSKKIIEHGPLMDTPWHKATFVPGYGKIEKLINIGYSPYDKDTKGRTAFHLAALYDNADGLEYLLTKYPYLNKIKSDRFGATPLHIAAGKASSETVAVLINKGCNINIKNKGGWTAFFEAVLLNNVEAVKFFLENGISPNTRTPQSRTPLHEVATQGNSLLVKALLEAGALFNVADYQGKTPLYLAAQQGNLESVALLFDKGADVNATDKNDMNALHIAVQNNQKDVVQYLVSVANINIFQPDYLGRTPLDIAYILGFSDIISILALEFSKPSQE